MATRRRRRTSSQSAAAPNTTNVDQAVNGNKISYQKMPHETEFTLCNTKMSFSIDRYMLMNSHKGH